MYIDTIKVHDATVLPSEARPYLVRGAQSWPVNEESYQSLSIKHNIEIGTYRRQRGVLKAREVKTSLGKWILSQLLLQVLGAAGKVKQPEIFWSGQGGCFLFVVQCETTQQVWWALAAVTEVSETKEVSRRALLLT